MLKQLSLPLLFICFSATLTIAQKSKSKKSTAQGIQGVIIWKAGDQMPSPDRPAGVTAGVFVQREVYVYVLTNESNTVKNTEGFYTKVNTRLIKKFTTDKRGRFKVSLPVGKYSLFTKEENGFYANLFDESMNIFPVQVKRGSYTNVSFEITYEAVF